ncbi:MAG TPA: superoxide dismutase family protein [Gemmatimonadaceae bacterium]|nr:superoxide dismutase family protein [Gemmatimonadaceae bacterium]
MYREGLRLVIGSACCAAVTACASAPAPLNRVAVAYATLSSASGEKQGTAEMWQDLDKVVHVNVQVTGLPAGPHGIHFHAVGLCELSAPTPFATAGAHFNPLGREHGLDNPAGPHAGDAPNFTVASDGTGRAAFTTDRVSLTDGSTSLFDADGSAIVIHAAADDQISQPSGNSGARIACGVVKRGP